MIAIGDGPAGARGRGAARRRSTPPRRSRCCPTRAGRPACPRASCSPTPTSPPPSARSRPGSRLSERDTVARGRAVLPRHGLRRQPRRAARRRRDRRDDAALRRSRRYLALAERHRATVLVGAPPLMRPRGIPPSTPRPARGRADRLGRRAARRGAAARGRRPLPARRGRPGLGADRDDGGATMPDRDARHRARLGRRAPMPEHASSRVVERASCGCAGRR